MARYVNPVEQVADGNGKPLVGAELSFYEPNTLTLKTIFSDAGLTIPRANPVTSDENGRWGTAAEGGPIFLDGIYRTIGRDASGTPIPGLDNDPVGDVIEGEWQLWISDTIYEIPQIVRGSDDEFYRSIINSNQGNDPTTSPAAWEQLKLMREWNTNVTYAATNNAFGSDGNLYRSVTSSNQGNDPVLDTTGTNWKKLGNVLQVVNTQTGAVATGTTIMPLDDTIPQNTEGDEYMTLAITPKMSNSTLKIDVVINAACSLTAYIIAAIFQDSTAGALAGFINFQSNPNSNTSVNFAHYMTSGTTSTTTFKIRIGPNGASTITFNGISGGRHLGGVMASSITITEYQS